MVVSAFSYMRAGRMEHEERGVDNLSSCKIDERRRSDNRFSQFDQKDCYVNCREGAPWFRKKFRPAVFGEFRK